LVISGLGDVRAVATLSRAMGSPFEVTGAAYDPAAGETLLRVEGFEASVAYRLEQLKGLLACPQMDVIAAKASAKRWAALRDVTAFHAREGDVWRVSCKPSDAPALAAQAGGLGRVYDWAGGLIWILAAPGTDLRARLGKFDGHATIVRASAGTKAQYGVFHPESAGVATLTRGLRQRFDPKGLFNAHLMEPAV
jgi:glycolate oxidase FAD binding subunit